MWQYEKKLQYPVNIKNPNPALAKVIVSQLGGPDGDASSSRFFDNRPVKVYTDYQKSDGSWLNIKVVDYSYEDSAALERTTAVTHIAGTSQVQTTVEERYGEAPAYAFAAGKSKFSQGVDGVQSYHDYEAANEFGALHKHTVITKAAGECVAGQSRMREEFIAADDTITFERESVWDGEHWQLLSSAAYEYDAQRRVVKTTYGNGRVATAAWMCCGKLRETDEDGVTTTYGYNAAHQLEEVIREEILEDGTIITPETITTYTRDAADRVLSTRRDTGAMTTIETLQYDLLGREVSRTDALGRTTTTAYSADGLTTTVTTPAGATLITTHYADGSLAAVGGTGQRALVYEYAVQGHLLCTTVRLADEAGTLLSQTLTNGFGQTVQQLQPTTTGAMLSTMSEYNARGQLVRQYQQTQEPAADEGEEAPEPISMAPTLYEYDSFGNLTKQTLALEEEANSTNS